MTDELLYETEFGSYLYGTNIESSDRDYKRVTLPSLADLVLGRGLKNSVSGHSKERGVKNGVGDEDVETLPIQVLAKDYICGQTYAIEVVHSALRPSVEEGWFKEFAKELAEKFTTRNVKAMLGYAMHQANLYSAKGERLNALVAVENLLSYLVEWSGGNETLGGVLVRNYFAESALATHTKYVNYSTYDIGSGVMAPCLVVVDKTYPCTWTVEYTLSAVRRSMARYGARAGAAASAGGVDWKALMHAVRIAKEGIELLQTGKVTLPVCPADAEYLIRVRKGQEDYAAVSEVLIRLVSQLEDLAKTSPYPEYGPGLQEEFDKWLSNKLLEKYLEVTK